MHITALEKIIRKTTIACKGLGGALKYLFFTGFALNVLALFPHMLEHFDEPDEFSKTCAHNIVQVSLSVSLPTHYTVFIPIF